MRKLSEFHQCRCNSACGQVGWEDKEITEPNNKTRKIRIMVCYHSTDCKNCEKNDAYECVCVVFRAKPKKKDTDEPEWETHDVGGYMEYSPDYNYECKCVSTRLLIQKRSSGVSLGEYKIGEDPNKPEHVPLGKNTVDAGGGETHVGHLFEILYPKGPTDCPNKIKQFVQATEVKNYDVNGDWTKAETKLPADGGYGSDKWKEDTNPAGVHVSDMFPGSFGQENTYIDNPGPVYKDKKELPYSYKAKFRIELRDCHDKLIDCMIFEVFIEIDGLGNVTKNESTSPAPCK